MLCTVKYADNCPEVKMVWGQSLGFLTARQVRSCRLDRCEKCTKILGRTCISSFFVVSYPSEWK